MVFSSIFFLFAFLPLAILGYYGQYVLYNNRLRNFSLLIASYLFYLFGAPRFHPVSGRFHLVRLRNGPLYGSV